MNSLEHEANIVLIAANDTARGEVLDNKQLQRLYLATDRIFNAINFGARMSLDERAEEIMLQGGLNNLIDKYRPASGSFIGAKK